MTEVALFPIPNLVSFPGTLVPLHVFEPRYRALIKESVKLGRPIGVSHTKGVISQADHSGSMADRLNKNQDTYEPYEIFSAGPCEITDVTGDGRLLAEIKMDKRYRLGELVQEVPYRVYKCEEYQDLPEEHDDLSNIELKNKLDKFLVNSVGDKESQLKDLLESESWKNLPLSNYGFAVFQLLKFEPQKMQEILELKTVGGRLSMALREIGMNS
jgi:Lon protease-like protein